MYGHLSKIVTEKGYYRVKMKYKTM